MTGCSTQTIELVEGCEYTPEQVVEALNGGDSIPGAVLTSLQENGGDLVRIDSEGLEHVLGHIVDVDMDAEYTDFELVDA